MMPFRTVVQLHGKTATGLEVPGEVVAALGSSKRPAVQVTVRGHSYRSTIAPMGGKFLLPLSAENREAAGVVAGDEVDVEVERDDQPREVTVPEDFGEALAADTLAKERFDGLSYSKKRAHILSIDGAKTPETRLRRITKAVDTLREG